MTYSSSVMVLVDQTTRIYPRHLALFVGKGGWGGGRGGRHPIHTHPKRTSPIGQIWKVGRPLQSHYTKKAVFFNHATG